MNYSSSEIWELLKAGYNAAEIAEAAHVSEPTAKLLIEEASAHAWWNNG